MMCLGGDVSENINVVELHKVKDGDVQGEGEGTQGRAVIVVGTLRCWSRQDGTRRCVKGVGKRDRERDVVCGMWERARQDGTRPGFVLGADVPSTTPWHFLPKKKVKQ